MIGGTVAVNTTLVVAVGCTGGRVGWRVGWVAGSSVGAKIGNGVGRIMTTGKVGVGRKKIGAVGRAVMLSLIHI